MKNKILVVVAHSDDEVLGCGGAISKHVANQDEVFVLVLTDGESSRGEFNIEKRHEAFLKSCHILGIENHYHANLKDGQLDTYPLVEVIRIIEKVATEFGPTIVYTHNESDLNIDHTITHRAVMTAFRGTPNSIVSQILTFEIPSSAEWANFRNRSQFVPNYFIELTEKEFKTKMKALNCYANELREFPHPRSEEYLEALAKVRGGSVGVKLAEAFFAERIIIRS
ncbi:PIG-L deacetylase family protein [Peredibacter sp. HCB2-198]|uniref:PIG-L deacetylase family protein n=1 Tax=Peredibacter sp. HCB2-198 TaxID=3383025 RepID=UPI0038B644AA